MKFRIAVNSGKNSEFEKRVIDMSTPGHHTYGKHMRHSEMKEFLQPPSDVSNAIKDWLAAEQVPADNVEDDGDWISFIVPIGQAESMLDAHFYSFKHKETGVTRIRTLQYSVPTALHGLIDLIQPTTRFGTFRPQASFVKDSKYASVPANLTNVYDPTFCNTTVTPACLRGLYEMGNFTAQRNNGNSIGISGYLSQLARYTDLSLFNNKFAPYAKMDNFTVCAINNGTTDQHNMTNDATEANLDVQYAMALSVNTPMAFYSTGGLAPLIPDLDQPIESADQNEPYLEQLMYLRNLPDDELPKVLSTSYGEDEQSVPASYTDRACNLFAQLGSRGVSVIFSSGDTGPGSGCLSNDGKNTTQFQPIWPAGCPFVTSVGGTQGVQPERATDFSSGGFSNRFARPSYQEDAVADYLEQLGDTFQGLYNATGRGMPDVAAQSLNYMVYDFGALTSVGGTSCAAPTFSAIITSLNSVRLSQNKAPLGFLNPWIYSTAKAGLTDITHGGSTGCDGVDIYSGLAAPYIPGAGWNATEGWDPVTGLGTPKFMTLMNLMP